MPMTCSNQSMFPPSEFDYEEFATDCKKKYGVSPRPHWITTEFGGEVRFFNFILISLLHFQSCKENKTTNKRSGDQEAVS